QEFSLSFHLSFDAFRHLVDGMRQMADLARMISTKARSGRKLAAPNLVGDVSEADERSSQAMGDETGGDPTHEPSGGQDEKEVRLAKGSGANVDRAESLSLLGDR